MLLTHNPIESARDCRRYHHWCEAIHKLVEREASCWTDPKRSLNLIRRLHNATERTNMVETDHKAEASKRLSTLLERLNADVQNIHAQQVEEATQKLKAAEDKLNRKMQNPGGAEPEPEDPAVAKARLRKYIEQKTREFASKAKHAYSKFLSAKKLTWGDKGTRWRTWDKSRCAFGLVSARKGEWSFEMAVKELQQGRDEGESIIVDEFLEDFEREHRILYDMVFFCLNFCFFVWEMCLHFSYIVRRATEYLCVGCISPIAICDDLHAHHSYPRHVIHIEHIHSTICHSCTSATPCFKTKPFSPAAKD